MKLTKDQKKQKSQELAKKLQEAAGVFFANYQGLKFNDASKLRKKLSGINCSFNVIRNSVVSHAIKNADIKHKPDDTVLRGPTAMALLTEGDIVAIAREFAAFAKEIPALKMKACFSDNKWYDKKECEALSKLLTRTQTLSHLASSLYTCTSKMASVLQAPMRDLAFVLKALESKRGKVTA
jgi:large subunit ribosomal protein L10